MHILLVLKDSSTVCYLFIHIIDDLTLNLSLRCNKPEVDPTPGCTDAEQELYEGPAYCGLILDTNGPFAACHPKVNPNVSEAKSDYLKCFSV